MVQLSAQFFTWPSVSVYRAPVSVRCVAVRGVMQFFHVCLFSVVISVVSVVVPRLAPSTDPPPGCNPPWCATDRGASTVQGSVLLIVLVPFVPGVAVLLIVLVTARAIVGVHRRLLLLGIVPGLADTVPVSFSDTASIT